MWYIELSLSHGDRRGECKFSSKYAPPRGGGEEEHPSERRVWQRRLALAALEGRKVITRRPAQLGERTTIVLSRAAALSAIDRTLGVAVRRPFHVRSHGHQGRDRSSPPSQPARPGWPDRPGLVRRPMPLPT